MESRNEGMKTDLFDPLSCPLAGPTLIEASAGTGKTYAITGLFLRLLLEARLPVSRILVVTFTVAATAELRDRVRRQLRAALAAFGGRRVEDPFLRALASNHPRPGEAVDLLTAAVRNFDEAPIYTIHGFCARVLMEHAFDSGGLFENRMMTDDGQLRGEVVRDFWRRTFYDAPLEAASWALKKDLTVETLEGILKGRLYDPALVVLPRTPAGDLAGPLEAFRRALRDVEDQWRRDGDGIRALLFSDSIARNRIRDPEALLTALEDYLAGPPLPVPGEVAKLSDEYLKTAVKKGRAPLAHPFFAACGRLIAAAGDLEAAVAGWAVKVKRDLVTLGGEELKRRKEQEGLLGFDDLVTNLHDALRGVRGDDLAAKLRGRYGAALIDEFQDTDPLQYAIFEAIFGGGKVPLFLIGDAKQAIYGFRGADIFAYLKAARDCTARYTLETNWRSEGGLVAAVNHLFSLRGRPFLLDEIPFAATKPADEEKRACLTVGGRRVPPLVIWQYTKALLEGHLAAGNKEKAADLVARDTAREIAGLVARGRAGEILIGGEPLTAGDIAVLVRTNREARLVQEALREAKVPAILHSTGNLFETKEAQEMERLLRGVAEPSDGRRFRAARATALMGFDPAAPEAGEDEVRQRFFSYQDLWARRGFLVMFRRLLDGEGVRERLLAYPDGERRLTNTLHLMEALHSREREYALGMRGLIKWLAAARRGEAEGGEEKELRLESDARAVRIVTVHKSKGLEYPVVFCPFAWTTFDDRGGPFLYHDPDNAWRPTLVLSETPEADREAAARESLAEAVRLFYVAVTRARHRAYVAWGPFPKAKASAVAYLLHGRDDGSVPEELTDEIVQEDLLRLAAAAQGTIVVETPPPAPPPAAAPGTAGEERDLACLTFPRRLDERRALSSFSSLVSPAVGTGDDDPPPETPEGDEAVPHGETIPGGTPSPLTLPRGARTGNLIHDVLQETDFPAVREEATEGMIAGKLRRHGFDALWLPAVRDCVRRAAAAPLTAGGRTFRLEEVPREETVREMAFLFPTGLLTPEGLTDFFLARGLPRPAFPPSEGFMKGYIDLVFRHEGRFFILDWKTNFLGFSASDYAPENLEGYMEAEGYTLQYLIYTLALHRYLARRLRDYDYDRHFGAVFWVFIRGLDPGLPGHGIFTRRPGRGEIRELEERFLRHDL